MRPESKRSTRYKIVPLSYVLLGADNWKIDWMPEKHIMPSGVENFVLFASTEHVRKLSCRYAQCQQVPKNTKVSTTKKQ